MQAACAELLSVDLSVQAPAIYEPLIRNRRGRTAEVANPKKQWLVPHPTWATWREALAVCAYRPHLRKTVAIAAIVGTVLFAINQLDVVLAGRATLAVWLKVALTYLVPFCVSNWGILVATRRPEP